MAVANVFTGRQILRANSRIELGKTCALRIEDLLQSLIRGGFFGFQSFLAFSQRRNPKESLECRIDPAGSFHVLKSKHLTLTQRTC